MVQEFAYWVITTAWGLQEDPGRCVRLINPFVTCNLIAVMMPRRERQGSSHRQKVQNAEGMQSELPAVWKWFEVRSTQVADFPCGIIWMQPHCNYCDSVSWHVCMSTRLRSHVA